jgi:hypothetical protein
MRISAASLIAFCLYRVPLSGWAVAALLSVAATLLAGFFTRLAALVCTLLAAMVLIKADGLVGWMMGLQALNAAALAILGAGAYSIDAQLFGRRVIDFHSDR